MFYWVKFSVIIAHYMTSGDLGFPSKSWSAEGTVYFASFIGICRSCTCGAHLSSGMVAGAPVLVLLIFMHGIYMRLFVLRRCNCSCQFAIIYWVGILVLLMSGSVVRCESPSVTQVTRTTALSCVLLPLVLHSSWRLMRHLRSFGRTPVCACRFLFTSERWVRTKPYWEFLHPVL